MKLALTAAPSAARFAPILLRGDIVDAFALAAELGYDGVEMHLRQPGDIDRAAARKLTDYYGLGIPTLGTGMAAGEDRLTFTDPDPEIQRRAVERVKEHIDLAAYLSSAVTIGLLSGWLGSDPQQRPLRRAAALACLEECCQAAAGLGITDDPIGLLTSLPLPVVPSFRPTDVGLVDVERQKTIRAFEFMD